jgi:hypothetical protein
MLSGVVAAASLLTAIAAPEPDPTGPTVVDTTATFEDLNGNGIDDDCETDVAADDQAAADAEAAVDLDGDGTVSVSEAAQSDRTGGVSCNHGGYVSNVAQAACDEATDADADGADADAPADGESVDADEASTDASTDADETSEAVDEPESDEAACDATEATEPAEDTEEAPAECETTPTDEAPTDEDAPADEPVALNGHGKVVRDVAKDKEAVGGKNCNHGGAVSEASHQDNDARKEAREAAKAARDAAREAAKATREAAKGSHGKGNGGNH